ncbi:Carcinoembryonic antigen-related cell adhesion molecule 1 [Takifugu flavidus]|uniref:Carcinoembryonic antigen-related cell adhesion molecule 1 n=1 Tax=Takifugu flavidus TaxID=433684 RepID=A0A5C6NFE4_9TELE|nr:Carcinoembryonic antigen-related cell adhesion molecule 1 [Takifugu flavidus]
MDLSHSLLVLLSFLGFYAAQEILPEGPVDVVLGKNVTLRTLLVKPEYMFIVWTYNDGADQVHVVTLSETGLKVNAPYEGRVSVDPDTGSLFLAAAKGKDSGDYGISIISKDGGTKTAEIKLRVLEPVSDVTIKSNLAEAMEHNSTVVLSCSAKGSFLKFTWTNRTKPLIPDGKRITLKEEELSSVITITGVLRWDLQGPISCEAANKLESDSSAPFNLTVYYGPEMVAIAPPTPPQFIKAGSDFNLSCSAESSPAATFQWFHNQQLMKNSGPTLTLMKIQELGFGAEAGQFSCVASNDKTKRAVTSAAVSFAVMGAITGVNVSGPTAVLLAGNSSANLSCEADAGEVLTVTWKKDGQALTTGGRVVFAKDMRSVMIEPVQKEDNGEYTCQLSNPVSNEMASYKMVVNYGPEEPKVSGEKAVEINDKVTLTCSAPSMPPANFTWRFNGTVTDVTTATYVIDKAVYKNTGTYTCEAHNAVTGRTGQVTHSLSVKEEGSLGGLSDGAIAGIVIAVLVAVGAAIACSCTADRKYREYGGGRGLVESPY